MNNKKRLLILGAGRGQVKLIQAAKALGYTAVVASIQGDYPGFALADEICYTDISNPLQVYETAKEKKVDGVATACLDTGIISLGYTCERLGFCGLSEKAAKISGDKFLMKKAFTDFGVNTADYKKVSSREELERALQTLGFPAVVKAVDLQGSKGVYIVRNIEEAVEGFNRALEYSGESFCIIEKFLDGKKFDMQSFIYNGEILFFLPCGDITYVCDTVVPIGHYAPADLKEAVEIKAKKQAEKAIRAAGLDNCAVDVDLIVHDGEVYVIELTGRAAANCLPEITEIYFGIPYFKMVASMAAGEDPRPYFYHRKNGCPAVSARMLFSKHSGVLKQIINKNNQADIRELLFFIKEGNPVNRFQTLKDCLGQIIISGNFLEEVDENMEQAVSNITFELE